MRIDALFGHFVIDDCNACEKLGHFNVIVYPDIEFPKIADQRF